jgi:hypothetical protein
MFRSSIKKEATNSRRDTQHEPQRVYQLTEGVAGAFTREVTLEIDHAFRRWLIATLKVSGATVDYVGSPRADERYGTSALITYKLTREVWLKGEYRHEWRHSNVPGNDYQADVVLVGARLQR